MTGSRLAYLETIRGAACILLVSWHVIGDVVALDGLRLAAEHPLHLTSPLFLPIRMPLFALISGFVFSTIARDWGSARATLSAKARRLLVPMAAVGTLHFLLQSMTYNRDIRDIWTIYVGSYEHFWFLQATFLIIAVALCVSVLSQGRVRAAAFVCLLVSLPLYGLEFELEPVNWFSASRVFYLAPFFFLGQWFHHAGASGFLHGDSKLRGRVLLALIAATVAGYALFLSGAHLLGSDFSRRSYAMLALSLVSCALIFTLRPENKFLAWIGQYTYGIFLFHVIFTAGARVAGRQFLGIDAPYLEWLAGLTIGIAGPIVVIEALKLGPPLLSTVFLGVRYRRTASVEPSPVASAQTPSADGRNA